MSWTGVFSGFPREGSECTMGKKNVLKAAAFLLLFVLCFQPVSRLFSQPADRRNYQWIAGFYEEPENSLDAVYIGSSNCYAFWNPLLAWESHGITVYPYACNDQPFAATSYLITEVHKTQPEALIIVNLNSLRDTVISVNNMHYLLDNMPLSWNKLQLTRYLCREDGLSLSESMEFYLPIIRYHERWSELDQKDFDFTFNGLKGASNYASHLQTSQDITQRYKTGTEPMEPEAEVVQLVDDLLDYCDENQVNILFVTVPRAESKEDTVDAFLYLNQRIRDRGYPVLDLMDKVDEIGIETAKDYYNDQHTNIHGSIKFTRYLSDYLVENYGFRNKRGDARYESWDAGREKYAGYMDAQVLDLEYDGSERDYTLTEPASLKAKKQEGTIAVTWQPVEGAEGYAVYKKTGSGRWKRAAEVTEPAWTDTQPAEETTITYRVVPVRFGDGGAPCYGKFAYKGVSIKT